MTEQQIKNIYINCNRSGVDMEELLRLCLDSSSGITIEGLRAANYRKIDQLERRYNAEAEERIWEESKGSVEALKKYIEKCEAGIFSPAHLAEGKQLLRDLAIEEENQGWKAIDGSNDLNGLIAFISKIKAGHYSTSYLHAALTQAELLEWDAAKNSHQALVLNAYIQKCNSGYYPISHVAEAKSLLEEWESGAIISDWNKVLAEQDSEKRMAKLGEFVMRYAANPSQTAQKYIDMAAVEKDRLDDEKEARKDWIDASQKNEILDYVDFLSKHPYSEYREEAEQRIENLKGNLLMDMKRYPFKYRRETMYGYISTNALTMQDLVDNSDTLTDRAYSHIKRYPRLTDEQRQLPVSTLTDPKSEDGNTDVYFFGISGSGKTCVLAGLMSLTGQLGFNFDPKGPGGGGHYAMDLCNYARKSMLPPATDQNYIQVIDAQINDHKEKRIHKISLIEMSGEKTAQFAAIENASDLGDLGPGAEGLLSNNNNKVIFFVIDPTNEKDVQLGGGNRQWVMQSDVLNCVSSLLAKNKALMKKVVGIHIILTKSDTLGDYVDEEVIMDLLTRQGYQAALDGIQSLCEKYQINRQTGYEVGLFPFCVGKFMPGEVYTFDPTLSLKILRVIQRNTVPVHDDGGWWTNVKKWFYS